MSTDWLSTLPPLRETIATHGLGARKELGQHFLLDLNLTARIVRAAGDLTGCTVFEIGPGPGGLTRPLLASAAPQIIAVERDARCVAALQELIVKSADRLRLIEADALKIDLTALASAPRAIVANLPYNIGTDLLIGWLRRAEQFRSLTLMFQAEVADRIVAKAGTKAYGRLSVISQFCCHATRVMTIPARAFTPPPKIDSAVVHLIPRTDRPTDVAFKDIETITAAAFGQRRKMLRSSLRALGGEALLERAGIAPTDRAEDVDVNGFVTLARAWRDSHPTSS